MRRALFWCRSALTRLVPTSPARVALFCAILALASLRCLSDFVVAPAGGGAAPRFKLAFTDVPREGVPGLPIPTVRVAVTDRDGVEAKTVKATVTLGLVGGPPGATLGGDRTAPVVNGSAVFHDLVVDSAGQYRLAARPDSATIAPDTSAPFALTWPPVDELRFTRDRLTLPALNDTVTLAVEARGGGRIVPAPPLQWRSTNEAVVLVDAAGLVRARTNGQADVIASVGTVSAQLAVTVRQQAAAIILAPADLALGTYQSATLTAAVTDANGFVVATPQLSWSSNRPKVVMVAPVAGSPLQAVVRRLRSGDVTITASMGGTAGTATVH